jgi:hypothetical protein
VVGNYCTWNPLFSTTGPISNGNLEVVGASAWRNTKGTISVSTGKWYFEATSGKSDTIGTEYIFPQGWALLKQMLIAQRIDVNTSTLYGNILAFSQTGHVNNFSAPSSSKILNRKR